MSGTTIKKQQLGDKSISLESYNNMVEACLKFLRMRFDPKYFLVSNSLVTMKAATGVADIITKSFSITQSGNSAVVLAGTIRMQSSNEAVAGATIALTGSPCWIYVYELVDHSDRGIAKSANEPVNGPSQWVWPLAKFTTTSTGYELLDGNIYHDGDVEAQWILK